MSSQTINKSTKRRRFLEEVEVVDLYRANEIQSNSQFDENVNNTQMHIIPSNPSEASCVSNAMFKKNIPSTSKSIPDIVSSYLNCSIVDDLFPLNISESDDDMYSDDEATSGFLNFFDDKNHINNKIAQWAVTFNITNIALSALLKVLINSR